MATETVTIISGYRDAANSSYASVNTETWADLALSPYQTWANWSQWATAPATTEIKILLDLDEVGYRGPQITLDYTGTITLSVTISETAPDSAGQFDSQATTINFVPGTFYSFPQGRYYEWHITLTEDSNLEPPVLISYDWAFNQEKITEHWSDLDTSTLSGSLGARTVTTTLGLVKTVLATVKGDKTWIDRAYVLPDDWSQTTYAPIVSWTAKDSVTLRLTNLFGEPVDHIVDLALVGYERIIFTGFRVI